MNSSFFSKTTLPFLTLILGVSTGLFLSDENATQENKAGFLNKETKGSLAIEERNLSISVSLEEQTRLVELIAHQVQNKLEASLFEKMEDQQEKYLQRTLAALEDLGVQESSAKQETVTLSEEELVLQDSYKFEAEEVLASAITSGYWQQEDTHKFRDLLTELNHDDRIELQKQFAIAINQERLVISPDVRPF